MPLLATTLVPRALVAERRCRFPYLRKILTLFPSCVIDLRLTVVTSHLLGQIGAVATNCTPPAPLVWVIACIGMGCGIMAAFGILFSALPVGCALRTSTTPRSPYRCSKRLVNGRWTYLQSVWDILAVFAPHDGGRSSYLSSCWR